MMKKSKTAKRLITASAFLILLGSGLATSATTITSYGNKCTTTIFNYAYSYTGTEGGFAGTSWYGFDKNSTSTIVKVDGKYTNTGWVQTDTKIVPIGLGPSHSYHESRGQTRTKDF